MGFLGREKGKTNEISFVGDCTQKQAALGKGERNARERECSVRWRAVATFVDEGKTNAGESCQPNLHLSL